MILNIQEVGGVRKTVDKAVGVMRELMVHADAARREPISISELTLGLQCGGSDAPAASRQILPSVMRVIYWLLMAVVLYLRKRRKFMEPNSCSHVAQSRASSPIDCSIRFVGGKITQKTQRFD